MRREGLYAKAEELIAWYPAGGFVARGKVEGVREGGGNVLVSVSTLVCRDVGAVVRALGYPVPSLQLWGVCNVDLTMRAESSPIGSTRASRMS